MFNTYQIPTGNGKLKNKPNNGIKSYFKIYSTDPAILSDSDFTNKLNENIGNDITSTGKQTNEDLIEARRVFVGAMKYFRHKMMGHEIFFKIFDGPQSIFLCSIFVILFFNVRGLHLKMSKLAIKEI